MQQSASILVTLQENWTHGELRCLTNFAALMMLLVPLSEGAGCAPHTLHFTAFEAQVGKLWQWQFGVSLACCSLHLSGRGCGCVASIRESNGIMQWVYACLFGAGGMIAIAIVRLSNYY